MLQWSPSSLPPASLHPMEMFHWKLKAFQSIVLMRHSFPSRFHDPSCTTITLKSSQAPKTKAIISHILERKTEEGNEREREREKTMFMLEAEASTCWVVGVQEKKLCVRYFAWFSFHWSACFCRGLPPGSTLKHIFLSILFSMLLHLRTDSSLCNLHLLIPISESSNTCR